MSVTEENPSYITAVELYGIWHVNFMQFNTRTDAYEVTMSKKLGVNKYAAVAEAVKWAKVVGLEYRP